MSIIQRQLLDRAPVGGLRPGAAGRRGNPAAPSARVPEDPANSAAPVESGALIAVRGEPLRLNNVAAVYAAMQQQGDAARFREISARSRLDLSA